VLEAVDLARSLPKTRYQRAFPPLQERLRQLQYQLLEAEIPTIIVLEGWDAAGKGSTIGRLTERLDPRACRAYPGSPPSELEQRYHWLWRYQIRLPEDGHIALFDHSWYGRVLVERVERYVKRKVWSRAFEQINEFERWLTDDGQVVVKLFFHISQKEQRRRLKAIEDDPREHWRVAKEDWRRNKHYDEWLVAIEDMLARTDTPHAPWTVIEATDARWTRVKVFETLVRRMEEALKRRQATPASVSRTKAAQTATRVVREKRAAEDLDRARSVAAEAGLPIEEQ
jgi:polyphosphate kinase 2 (PPK2 family)